MLNLLDKHYYSKVDMENLNVILGENIQRECIDINMKAEIMVEGFQESEIRKVCIKGQGSAKNILVSMRQGKRRKETYILKKKD